MDQLVRTLRVVVGRDAVLSEPDELLVYECDGLPQHKHRPRAVVFPSSTEETSEVMRVLAGAGVPLTPRGAGTGLSGGALALEQGVVIELARMRRILKIDQANRIAVVQTGVVNAHVSRAVAKLNLHYVPDPSSQPTCTIGGNIAESAGGIHCLKYGTTTDHVLGARVVLCGGEVVDLGGPGTEQAGYDLLGVFVGSEGTFGIATEATLRLVPVPPAVRTLLAEFLAVNDASHAVSAIIAAGVIPAGLEMMDREIIRAVEASVFAAGLPLDIGAALLIELDGLEAGIDDEAERLMNICREYGARNCRLARDENERKKLWAARKGAFGAIGRISPDSMIQDAVVPRSRLPEVLADAYQIAAKYQLRIANVFHAGDGNLHPLICFDSRFPEQVHRVKEAGRELMETCVRAGGTITGEHGVGLDKRDLLPLIFSDDDMETMLRVRAAFDPSGLMNQGKIIPLLRGCGEARALGMAERDEEETERTGDGTNGRPGDGSMSRRLSHRLSFKRDEVPEASGSDGSGFDVESAFDRLAEIVGAGNVASGLNSPGFDVSTSSPLLVSPGTIEEICEVMKLASRAGWAVVPAGAATWLNAGNPLRRADVILSTRRLKQIIEHEPADLVAITQPGISLSEFNQELGHKGQWLPLDPPDDGRSTIGGVVATGIAGPLRHGYGSPRSSVIGMRVVLADGRVVRAGGRVVKNVAGYDLCKLFTGSYGTLGVIVEVNFKLRPLPERQMSIVASGNGPSLIEATQSILRVPLLPVAVELLSARMARAVNCGGHGLESVLMTRFAGNNRAVEYQTQTALSMFESSRGISTVESLDAQNAWKALAAVPTGIENYFSWRASVPPAELDGFIKAVNEPFDTTAQSLAWHANVADGRIRVIENSGVEIAERVEIVRGLRRTCEASGGSLVVENATPAAKENLDSWGLKGAAGALTGRVKKELDPANILSPGRFGLEI